ncbi:MAG TPA: lysylphosphatidylglycerol synthase transmembrane domain-containing protein [Thermoanaerobaculia bacterium]|nr:lysylphosphatidylglycerol synthase transmembrane domain-containing protein [Thermoanaerobaculia bacterium]
MSDRRPERMPARASASEAPPAARRGPWLWLRLAVSAALVAWILARTPFREVAAAFRSADPRFVLLALALNPLGYLASVSRWRLLIRAQGGDAALPFLVRSFLVGVFFNNLLPSTIGGDAVRAMDTSRTGVGRAKAVAIVFVDRFVGLLALMLFAALSVLASGRLTERVPALYAWVLGGAAAMGALAGLLFVLPRIVASRFSFRWPVSVLARAFAWSLLLQTLVVLNGYFLARALHVPIPLPAFFLIVPLAIFVMMLPVSINAIGVRENVWAFFFAAFGVSAALGVAVAWLDYGLVLLQALAGGMVYATRRSGEKGKAQAAVEAIP